MLYPPYPNAVTEVPEIGVHSKSHIQLLAQALTKISRKKKVPPARLKKRKRIERRYLREKRKLGRLLRSSP